MTLHYTEMHSMSSSFCEKGLGLREKRGKRKEEGEDRKGGRTGKGMRK